MRRKDREVLDPAKVQEIIGRCSCCRLGFCDDGEVYILPLCYGYEIKDGAYVFYFHSASEGRKSGLIDKCPKVGFELDAGFELIGAGSACGFTARYQSVIGTGLVEKVNDPDEREHGLALIMEHYTGRKEWDFDERASGSTLIFKLTVNELSCKEHK